MGVVVGGEVKGIDDGDNGSGLTGLTLAILIRHLWWHQAVVVAVETASCGAGVCGARVAVVAVAVAVLNA